MCNYYKVLKMSAQTKIIRGSPHYYEMVRKTSPPVCNYRCAFCFSGMGNKRVIQDFLTKKELRKIITDAQDLGTFYIEISGEGEPLIYRKELEEIINFATTRGIHTLISTNGSLLTKGFLRFLAQNDASLTISLAYR